MPKLPYRQRGQVAILVAVSVTALIAIVGLALDAGLSYTVKAKLNAATDSASLAAARAVSQGNTQAEQTVNAKAAARRFFDANYPANYMMTTATMNEPTVLFEGGKVTIDVSARAVMPVSLMGVINTSPLAPGVASQTVRKELDMVLVLDTSGSLSGEATTVKSSSISFLKRFKVDQDRVGLIHFAYGSVVDDAIRPVTRGFDRDSMIKHINDYDFEGSTASPEGMWRAREMINSIATLNRSNQRVIVFFSDGSPNSFAAYLSFTNAADCKLAGVIATDDDGSGTPAGLYSPNAAYSELGGGCTPKDLYGNTILPTKAPKLPDWYNGHNLASNPNDPALREFPIVTTTPRVVTNTNNYTNVNRAARNLVEAIAESARAQGVVIFTLGLGSQLKSGTGVDKEKGEDTLKCMANTSDALARCYKPEQPRGVYCHAANEAELMPCFSKLASAILRISK